MKKVVCYLLGGLGCLWSANVFGRVTSVRVTNPVRNSGVQISRSGAPTQGPRSKESEAAAVVDTKSVSDFVSTAYARVWNKVDWSTGLQYDNVGCYETLMANFPELTDICEEMIDFIETHDDVTYINAGSYLEGVRR